ncbi:uncharacterized protein LOC103698748 isoform X2 [Phoenix dactylifera]|uniref:Uncharacterized protein LOC103698748 isoform X2 n=1 Tax=Phoenix dactylifera TaxID=42345 RepID=A0A8B7BK43_PHODC|nr:uncharacterized protein LOC103698748 isoform X2 [Phoenix dactylifera]
MVGLLSVEARGESGGMVRVANEVHSPFTRKNKEWQEKLPFVVLKAEEIMYSKANSEAEYMDLKTLRDRANDAIDTIIRKDETTESGDLLQPCIEAALNLGCIPRRASRSQRHSNPGCYLSSAAKDVTAAPLKLPDNSKNNRSGSNSMAQLGSSGHLLPPPPPSPPPDQVSASQFASWCSTFLKPIDVNPGIPEVKSASPDASHKHEDSFPIANPELHYPWKHSPLSCQDRMPNPMDTSAWPSSVHVYPLYYSHNQPKAGGRLSHRRPQEPHCSMVRATMPGVLPPDEAEAGYMQDIPGSRNAIDSSKQVSNFIEAPEEPPHTACDLSLRLGRPSPPSLGAEHAWTNEVEDVGSSSSCDGGKFYDPSPKRTRAWSLESSFSPPKDNGFDSPPVESTDEPAESCSSKWSSEGEGTLYVEAFDKGKATAGGPFHDGCFYRRQKISTIQLSSRTETPNS